MGLHAALARRWGVLCWWCRILSTRQPPRRWATQTFQCWIAQPETVLRLSWEVLRWHGGECLRPQSCYAFPTLSECCTDIQSMASAHRYRWRKSLQPLHLRRHTTTVNVTNTRKVSCSIEYLRNSGIARPSKTIERTFRSHAWTIAWAAPHDIRCRSKQNSLHVFSHTRRFTPSSTINWAPCLWK